MRKIIGVMAGTKSGVIGKAEGGLPWCYPSEFAQFKERIKDGVIITGRKSYEDPGRYPCKGIIVLSRRKTLPLSEKAKDTKQVWLANSLEQCLDIVHGLSEGTSVFMVGGAQIARLFVNDPRLLIRKFVWTTIERDYEGEISIGADFFTGWTENLLDKSQSEYKIYELTR